MKATRNVPGPRSETEGADRALLAPARNLTGALIVLLTLFLIPLVLAGYWVVARAEREIVDLELMRHGLRARALAEIVQREFVPAQTLLQSIAHRRLFRQAWMRRDQQGLRRHLEDLRELESAFLFASVYELDGTLRVIVPEDPIVGLNYAFRDWYRGVTANWEPYVSEVYRTAAAPHPLVVAIAVPIPGEKGEPIGILMAPYALAQLREKFVALEVGSLGEPLVVDQRGKLVTGLQSPAAGDPVDAPEREAFERARRGSGGSGLFGTGAEARLVGYAPVAKLGWAVIYRRPAWEALAAVERLRRQSMVVGLYLLLIYLVTAGVAARLVRRQGRLLSRNQALNEELQRRVEDLKQAQQALRESQERYALAVDGTHDGLWDWNLTTNDVYFSPRWKSMLGCTEAEIENHFRAWEERLHPDDRERALATVEAYLRGGTPTYELEHRLRHKDGGYRWILARGVCLRDAHGQPYRMAGSHTDITERKQAEEALRHAKEEAERISRFKDQFLSTMSHELRTPLNAVLGFSELLQDRRYGPLNDRQRRYVQHIHAAGQHLLRLINDILDLSKIEAGRMEITIEDVALEGSLLEVLDALRPLAERKSQTLACDAAPPLRVRADRTRLKQILINLIGNAIKFTPEGGQVRVSAAQEGSRARVEVRDTGPGIAPEQQTRLFEAFSRLGAAGGHEGTGLGLAITKRLVELQGGELGVHTQPGQGSCFYFSLALSTSLPRVAGQAASRPEGLATPRILVIENDSLTAGLIRAQLESAGYRVTLCERPENAPELAAQLQPQALTLDILMHPLNGFDALLALKQNPLTARIPVVVLTVIDQPAIGLALGADEYLLKPVEKSALLAAVERCRRQGVAKEPARPILVVEDDGATRELIQELLAATGHSVVAVADGAAARAWMARERPEMVILDLVLPQVSGIELLAEWRADARTADLPVFVLTSKDVTAEEERYLRQQAECLLRKQFPWQQALLQQVRRVTTPSVAGSA